MTIKVLNQEFEFDIFDLDTMERYETAAKVYEDDRKSVKGYDVASIRKLCEITSKFINSVLGEDVTNKLFSVKKNYRDYTKAVTDILEAVATQRKEFECEQADRTARIAKYIPSKRK